MAAFFIDFSVEHIADFKFGLVRPMVAACNRSASLKNGTSPLQEEAGCLAGPWAVLTAINVGFVFIASAACAYGAQAACGSGIPEIKCFLNGIRSVEPPLKYCWRRGGEGGEGRDGILLLVVCGLGVC